MHFYSGPPMHFYSGVDMISGVEPTLGDLGVQPRPLEEFLTIFKDKYS
jgi:hypothetical protein